MNADKHPPLLTDGDEEDLIQKLADAYRRTEEHDSEEWVRVIAAKTTRILAGQPAED